MRVNLGDFFLVATEHPHSTFTLYRKTEDDKIVVKVYDYQDLMSKVHPQFWIEADIRKYCKSEGLEICDPRGS